MRARAKYDLNFPFNIYSHKVAMFGAERVHSAPMPILLPQHAP